MQRRVDLIRKTELKNKGFEEINMQIEQNKDFIISHMKSFSNYEVNTLLLVKNTWEKCLEIVLLPQTSIFQGPGYD